MRLVLYLCLLLFSQLAWAQSWQADWTREGQPAASLWRYDRDAFRQGQGSLRLAVPQDRPPGLALLVTNLTLPSAPCWRGTLHFDQRPSHRNYPQVLLCATQRLSPTSFEYLALDFGGLSAGSVSLIRLVVTSRPKGSPVLTLATASTVLLASREYIAAGQDLAFTLTYDTIDGWSLYLQDLQLDKAPILVGTTTDYLPKLTTANTLGIACHFSEAGRQAWSFRDFSITPASSPPPEEPEPTPAPRPTHSPLLSEVMARPTTDAPEYIELYNPSEEPLTLGDYSLLAGSDEEHLHACSLPAEMLPPRSYAVLTSSEKALRSAYPQTPAEALVIPVSLPRLTNKAGIVYLVYQAEATVDVMRYSTELLPRGKRSKAGIAYERTNLDQPTEAGRWKAASSASGYATPGLPPSASEAEANGSPAEDLQACLSRLSQSPQLTVEWEVYTLTGQLLGRGQGATGKAQLLLLRQEPRRFFALLSGQEQGSPILLRLRIAGGQGAERPQGFLLRYP